MKFTKRQAQARMASIKRQYRRGGYSAQEVAQYESLRNWTWARAFLSLKEAQAFCKRKGINSRVKYRAFRKTHKNTGLPSNPNRYYGISWREFFGKTKPVFMSLKNARAFCKRVGLDGQNKYRAFVETHKNTGLPFNPNVFYGVSWAVFLGKKPHDHNRYRGAS